MMGVKQHVFGSFSERRNYQKLIRQWSKDYYIYHNLPFMNIFDINKEMIKKLKLSESQIDFLKKTSIDYTLCDHEDKPIVCIDFDGLQQGFNLGTKYYSEQKSNLLRKKGFDLKLKISHDSSFPLFIVGTREFENLCQNIKLTVVDGVIGQIVSEKKFKSEIKQPFNPEKYGMNLENFLELSQEEQYYYFKKDCLYIEVDTYLENNPIINKASELHSFLGRPAYSLQGVHGVDYSIFYARSCVVNLKYGKVKSEVILPKFDTPRFCMGILVDKIAEILAFNKAINLIYNSDS